MLYGPAAPCMFSLQGVSPTMDNASLPACVCASPQYPQPLIQGPAQSREEYLLNKLMICMVNDLLNKLMICMVEHNAYVESYELCDSKKIRLKQNNLLDKLRKTLFST